MAKNDLELLQQYAKQGSEAAFAELVHRHLDLVYSAALRQVRSPQLAEEVAQSVFADLARLAAGLNSDTILSAWLYQVARRTAVDVVRRESRRQLREQLAVELADMNAQPTIWNQIQPLLEEAMESLEPAERNAVLLRYFENRTLREVGQTLGTSEDAAQKRVSRAVERLREFVSRRGITVGASGLALALATNAVQSAPLGLAATISSSAAIAGAALSTITTTGTTKIIAMTTLQKIAVTAGITAALGVGLYETYQVSEARHQLRSLRQQQAPLEEQLHQLGREREDALAKLAAAQGENDALRASLADLPKLRGEVGRLRVSERELAQIKAAADLTGTEPSMDAAFKTWAVRASRLRQRLNATSDARIPEMQFLTEKNWFEAVKDLKQLDTEDDFRRAFSNVRNIAKSEFVNAMQKALRGYTDANNGQLPQDLSQLKPFLGESADDSLLQRYKLLRTGSLADIPRSEYLVADTAPLVDEEHDATYKFSINSINSHSGDPAEDAIKEAGIQFASAHNDLLPTDASQLAGYLKKPIDPKKIQDILSHIPPGVTTLRQLQAIDK